MLFLTLHFSSSCNRIAQVKKTYQKALLRPTSLTLAKEGLLQLNLSSCTSLRAEPGFARVILTRTSHLYRLLEALGALEVLGLRQPIFARRAFVVTREEGPLHLQLSYLAELPLAVQLLSSTRAMQNANLFFNHAFFLSQHSFFAAKQTFLLQNLSASRSLLQNSTWGLGPLQRSQVSPSFSGYGGFLTFDASLGSSGLPRSAIFLVSSVSIDPFFLSQPHFKALGLKVFDDCSLAAPLFFTQRIKLGQLRWAFSSAKLTSKTVYRLKSPRSLRYVRKARIFTLAHARHSALSSVAGGGRLVRGLSLAFGPQHPAAHGILKLVVHLQGELVRAVDPHFGYLHRGTEKLMENRNFLQSLPYFDRFDYVANLAQEHALCAALEALYPDFSLSARVSWFRALFDELSRVLNHLLTLSATALDLSAMGPIFWAFEERENAMALLEQVSGARMHTNLYRPFSADLSSLTSVFFRDLAFFLTRCARSLNSAFLGLLNNRSLRSRLSYVGQLTDKRLIAYGVTGLIARSGGLLRDCRLQPQATHNAYSSLTVRTFVGRRGDNLDRFLLRLKELVETFRLLTQILSLLSPVPQAAGPQRSQRFLSCFSGQRG